MKKKITLLLLAIVCALCCAFAFAACGPTDSDKLKEEKITGIALDKHELVMEVGEQQTLKAVILPEGTVWDVPVSWDVTDKDAVAVQMDSVTEVKLIAIKVGEVTVTAKVEDKSATCKVVVNPPLGPEVTAEQWSKAMDNSDNYTLTTTRNGSSNTIKIDGEKRSQTRGSETQLFTKEGSNYYEYFYSNSVWTRSGLSKETYENSTDIYAKFLSFFKDSYSLFTYSDEYYRANSIDMTATINATVKNVVVEFVKGKLESIYFEIESGTDITEYTVDHIGNTAVAIPTQYVEANAGKQVTENQWENIINKLGVIGVESNVTVTGYYNGDTDYTYEVADGCSKFLQAGRNEYYAVYIEWDTDAYDSEEENNPCKRYEYVDDGWKYQNTECPLYFAWDLFLFCLKNLEFDNYDYNTTEEIYCSKEPVSIVLREDLSFEISEVEVKFDNGKLADIRFTIVDIDDGDRGDSSVIELQFTEYGETSVTLPEDATEMGQGGEETKDPVYIRNGNDEIISVIFQSGTKAIEASDFEDMTALQYVYIPATVTSAEGAFEGLDDVYRLYEGASIPGSTFNNVAFRNVGTCTEDGWIYEANKNEVSIYAYIGVGGEVTVPAQIGGSQVTNLSCLSLRGLGDTPTFLRRDDITKLTLTSASLTVEGGSFAFMSSLTEVELSASVMMIAVSKTAYQDCNLTAISLAGGYDNYQILTMTELGLGATPINLTDGADVLSKISGLGDSTVCILGTKDVISALVSMGG